MLNDKTDRVLVFNASLNNIMAVGFFVEGNGGLHFSALVLDSIFLFWVSGLHFSVWVLGLHFPFWVSEPNFYYTCYIYQHPQLIYDYTTWTMWFDKLVVICFIEIIHFNKIHKTMPNVFLIL
jgi:hypothetical protein